MWHNESVEIMSSQPVPSPPMTDDPLADIFTLHHSQHQKHADKISRLRARDNRYLVQLENINFPCLTSLSFVEIEGDDTTVISDYAISFFLRILARSPTLAHVEMRTTRKNELSSAKTFKLLAGLPNLTCLEYVVMGDPTTAIPQQLKQFGVFSSLKALVVEPGEHLLPLVTRLTGLEELIVESAEDKSVTENDLWAISYLANLRVLRLSDTESNALLPKRVSFNQLTYHLTRLTNLKELSFGWIHGGKTGPGHVIPFSNILDILEQLSQLRSLSLPVVDGLLYLSNFPKSVFETLTHLRITGDNQAMNPENYNLERLEEFYLPTFEEAWAYVHNLLQKFPNLEYFTIDEAFEYILDDDEVKQRNPIIVLSEMCLTARRYARLHATEMSIRNTIDELYHLALTIEDMEHMEKYGVKKYGFNELLAKNIARENHINMYGVPPAEVEGQPAINTSGKASNETRWRKTPSTKVAPSASTMSGTDNRATASHKKRSSAQGGASTALTGSDALALLTAPATPRKRGRPRKNPLPVAEDKSALQASVAPLAPLAPAAPPTALRGNIPVASAYSPETVRRFKLKVRDPNSKGKQPTQPEPEEREEPLVVADPAPAPPKRGRGRPRKYPLPVAQAVEKRPLDTDEGEVEGLPGSSKRHKIG